MTHPVRGVIVVALISAAPLVALAQAPAPSPARNGSSNVAATKAPVYTSAFDGFRRFDEQVVQPWREANENVRRIGGWQAYARESAGEGSAPAPSGDHNQHKPSAPGQAAPRPGTPGPSPEPVKAPVKPASHPAAKPTPAPHDTHQGHGGQTMHKKP